MRGEPLKDLEPFRGDEKQVDCVEIYLPKSIEFLSELYRFLREKVTNRLGQIAVDGFSVYEVDGVFRGEQLWQQRTLVIRLLLIRALEKSVDAVTATIQALGRELAAKVAVSEEEIWICHHVQTLTVFRGLKRILL